MSKQHLTTEQKARAFDDGMAWIDNEIRILRDKLKSKEWQPSDQIKNEIARYENIQKRFFDYGDNPNQAVYMPPPNLDLSIYIGKTGVLWNGHRGTIEWNGNSFNEDFPIRIGKRVFTKSGFYESDLSASPDNIKTIIP